MKDFNLESVLKEWLTPGDMKWFDKLVKYLEELGEKAKNIKTVDDAYDFAKELGMKCSREEFKEGAEALEYIGKQIEKAEEKEAKEAEAAYLDALAAYKTAEKHLNDAKADYKKFAGDLEAEFNENRKQIEEELKKAAKEEKKGDKEDKKGEKKAKKKSDWD